jgi:acetyl-CoA C-acetyltransferase
MGPFAEDTAQHYQFTREAQDAFAVESLKRSKTANEDGSFAKEIVPVTVKGRSGSTEVARDEQPFTADPTKIPKLKPAFRDGGTVTAANSSSISDGAAALVLMRASEAKRRKLQPLARIVGVAGVAQAPCLVHDSAGRGPSRSCWSRSAGLLATSVSTRSTRPLPS